MITTIFRRATHCTLFERNIEWRTSVNTMNDSNVEKGRWQSYQSFICSVVPVCAPAAIIPWCIPIYSYPPQVASLMKCISPGCVCISVESTMRSRVERWGAGRMSTGRKELFGVWCVYDGGYLLKKNNPPDCLFPIQKYCFAITEQTSRVQAECWRAALHSWKGRSTRGREQNSRIVWIC